MTLAYLYDYIGILIHFHCLEIHNPFLILVRYWPHVNNFVIFLTSFFGKKNEPVIFKLFCLV